MVDITLKRMFFSHRTRQRFAILFGVLAVCGALVALLALLFPGAKPSYWQSVASWSEGLLGAVFLMGLFEWVGTRVLGASILSRMPPLIRVVALVALICIAIVAAVIAMSGLSHAHAL